MAMATNPHDQAVRRAALPELLFAPDLALATDLPEDEADRAARGGRFGPQLYIKGKVAVLRKDFIATMTLRASRRDASDKEVLPDRDGAAR
jgi:hypothetical protein